MQNWGLKMTERELTEANLAALFAASKAQQPAPSEAFMARIAADAVHSAEQAARPVAQQAPQKTRTGLWSWLLGARAPGGVALAGVLGIWIGVQGPLNLPDPALLWTAPSDVSLLSDEMWYGLSDIEAMEWTDG